MALTAAQLQAQLLQQQQAEAANIVALIEAIVDGRLTVTNADVGDLEAKIAALNTLLDGDENTEGYQAFQNLVARLLAVETKNTEQDAAIAALQTALAAQNTTLTNRINTVESEAAAARTLLDGRVATLETQTAASAAARLSKDNEHDAAIAGLETTVDNLEAAITAESGRAVAAEQANAAAIAVERGRIDAANVAAQEFVTRDELKTGTEAAATGFINRLWAGRTRPAGLPNADGTTSA